MWRRCLTLSGCPRSGLRCWLFLLSLEVSALHTVAKWLNFWHLEHFFPYAGQFFPSGWAPTCPQYPLVSVSDNLICSGPAAMPRAVYSTSLHLREFSCRLFEVKFPSFGQLRKELCQISFLVDGFLNLCTIVRRLDQVFQDSVVAICFRIRTRFLSLSIEQHML